MEALVASEASQVIADWKAGTENLEGLIYMMFWLDAGLVQPLYIGKAEKYGKDGKALSVNIADVVRADGSVGQRARFCRWGDGYAYHIGDLSAVACPGHRAEKRSPKYVGWASNIFVEVPSATPRLRKPTYFWTKAWPRGSVGPWKDVGSTSLTFLEYLLIGLASETFACLLNAEGVNRRSRKPVTAA